MIIELIKVDFLNNIGIYYMQINNKIKDILNI